jgi:hypothetical protein
MGLRTVADVASPADLVDLDRYPIEDLDAPEAAALVADVRRALTDDGVALLHGFVKPEVISAMAEEAAELKAVAYLEDVWGSPYLGRPDESYPEGHPRRQNELSKTWVVGYDLVPSDSLLRALYEWDGLKDFVAAITGKDPLYRFGDPLGALNLAIMDEGHTQGWHYDNADFIVSLAIQSSEAGGLFECAPAIRDHHEENYDEVARVLRGEAPDRIEIYPMTPGTLMVFVGRHSVHRVTPVEGSTPRYVALFAYDESPDANSAELFKLVRYGRSEPVEPCTRDELAHRVAPA